MSTVMNSLDADRVKELYWSDDRMSLRRLSGKLGISRTSLSNFMDRKGIPKKPQGCWPSNKPVAKEAAKRVRVKEREYLEDGPSTALTIASRCAEANRCGVATCSSYGDVSLGTEGAYRLCCNCFDAWYEWIKAHPAKAIEQKWTISQFERRFSEFLFERSPVVLKRLGVRRLDILLHIDYKQGGSLRAGYGYLVKLIAIEARCRGTDKPSAIRGTFNVPKRIARDAAKYASALKRACENPFDRQLPLIS